MLSHDSQLEPASLAWQGLEAACSIPGQETGWVHPRVPAVWFPIGLAGVVMLATMVTWSGYHSSALLTLAIFAFVSAALHALWSGALSVRKDGDSTELDGQPTPENTGKQWDFELQPVLNAPHEPVDSECEDDDELVIWVELEDEDDENEESDGLEDENGDQDDSGPWDWPNSRDAS